MKDTDVEVVIVYQTSLPKRAEVVDLSQFYGCIQDDSFFRPPQPEQPERELLEGNAMDTSQHTESIRDQLEFAPARSAAG